MTAKTIRQLLLDDGSTATVGYDASGAPTFVHVAPHRGNCYDHWVTDPPLCDALVRLLGPDGGCHVLRDTCNPSDYAETLRQLMIDVFGGARIFVDKENQRLKQLHYPPTPLRAAFQATYAAGLSYNRTVGVRAWDALDPVEQQDGNKRIDEILASIPKEELP